MNKIKVYDIDAFVGRYYPEYEAFRYKKAAIFEGKHGVVFAEEEAVHQRENKITDSVIVPLCQKSKEKDGHITMAIASSAEMTVSLDEIVAKAPFEEMTMDDFFARRDYNPRCQDNYATLMNRLRDIGFDLNEYFVQESNLETNMPKYNTIVKCNLEADGTTSHKDVFLLTGDDVVVDEGLEVDLTGLFCFNTEFKSLNREVVAVVNSVDDILAFCNQHNISVPSTCLEFEGCLSVGACCDYILNNELVALGWEDDLSENMLRKIPLDKQMNKAVSARATNIKPDCPLNRGER